MHLRFGFLCLRARFPSFSFGYQSQLRKCENTVLQIGSLIYLGSTVLIFPSVLSLISGASCNWRSVNVNKEQIPHVNATLHTEAAHISIRFTLVVDILNTLLLLSHSHLNHNTTHNLHHAAQESPYSSSTAAHQSSPEKKARTASSQNNRETTGTLTLTLFFRQAHPNMGPRHPLQIRS